MTRFFSAIGLVIVLGACGGKISGEINSQMGDIDTLILLDFVNGELVGGSRQEDIGLGNKIRILATGEVGDEIHVHGYDLYIREGASDLVFDALIPGTFEVELEDSGRLLLRMKIS